MGRGAQGEALNRSPAAVPELPEYRTAEYRLLKVNDVAAILKLRPATVRRMAALGQVGYHRLNGKELRFTVADVDGLLTRTRVEARNG